MPGLEKRRIQVPDELKDALLGFAIAYLLERPGDVISYAATYFTKLVEDGKTTAGSAAQPSATGQTELSPYKTPNRCDHCGAVYGTESKPEDEGETDGGIAVASKTEAQRAWLKDALNNVLLLRSLDPEQIDDILDAMHEKTVCANEYIVKEGDDGVNFYIIQSGVYHCYIAAEQRPIHTYDNRGSFGERALFYSEPRTTTIQAAEDGKLWVISRQTFRHIQWRATRRRRNSYSTLLDAIPMLKALQANERLHLVDTLLTQTYAAGARILCQDEPADGLYFVAEGQVSVRMREAPSSVDEVEIGRIQAGGYFGELALVTNWPRAASVYAVDCVKLAFLDAEAMERLMESRMVGIPGRITDSMQQVEIFGSKNNLIDIW